MAVPRQFLSGPGCASLLRAVDLPELIADDLQPDQAQAFALAADPARLKGHREHLTGDPARLALFDTARTTWRIEAACVQMMSRRVRNFAPAPFVLEP